MRLKCLAFASVAFLMHQPLFAQASAASATPASAQGDVSVTIYNNDLALVQDIRRITLPTRRSRQEFPDVSARIRPETVTLSGEGGKGLDARNREAVLSE